MLGAGAVLRAPLARVPENAMKFLVGIAAQHLRRLLGRGGSGGLLAGRRGRSAGGVASLLAATALLVGAGLPAWPLTVLATVAVLLWPVRHASAEHRRAEGR